MNGIKTGINLRIWLHICKEGGMWTPDEIAEAMEVSREKARLTMHNMYVRSGMLTPRKVKNRVSYGVTPDCKLPIGLTIRDLASVGVIMEQNNG